MSELAHAQVPAAASNSASQGYGGFSIGDLRLALPMAALREVVPCGQLTALPCPATCVVGGIDLRGVLVPVVDLRLVLGRTMTAARFPSVVVMVHGGRILGLLVDSVSGVFSDTSPGLHPISVAGGVEALFTGCLQCADDGVLLSVLSPDALMNLPQVPVAQDPEPGRQPGAGDAQELQAGEPTVQMLLIRCGRVELAIDAMAVHATLSDPTMQASVLARGHCRGVTPYAGHQVPAVDLMALCGLGRLGELGPRQAFVMQLPAGMVAFLVEKVLDVVSTRPSDLIAVPACALERPELFAGALTASQLTVGGTRGAGTGSMARLVLDSTALRSDETVSSLAATNTALPDAGTLQAGAAAGSTTAAALRDMLTYAVGGESATPLDQVTEILPYAADIATFDADSRMLGVLVHRGRSVPVLCLSRLLAGSAADITPSSSVLVVEARGELMGFVVPALKAIEPAVWEPELPALGRYGGDEFTQATRACKLALVGSGANERMLPVLDLKRIARAIQGQCAAA